MLKNKPFWVTLILLAVYLSAGYFAGPRLVQPGLEEFVASELGRKLQFKRLQFDPITLSIELEQVQLLSTEQSAWPDLAMQADAVHIRFNFWRLAPAVSDLLITAPVLEMVAGAEQPYPFVRNWQQWRHSRPAESVSKAVSVARWRIQNGRIIQADEVANSAKQILLDQVTLQATKADPDGLREFSLDFRTAHEAEFSAKGLLNLSGLSAFGDYQLAAFASPSGIIGEVRAEGKFQVEAVADLLQIQLSDSHFQSGKPLVCWNRQLLCAQFDPLDARFDASLLAGTDRLRWQNIEAELEAFDLHLSLGQDRVELVRQWSFTGGGLDLKRLPAKEEEGSFQMETDQFEISLNAQGELNLSSAVRYDRRPAIAEAQFRVTGAQHLQGELRLRDFFALPAQTPFSQLELQLGNPAAHLAREFIDQHLSGAIAAENFGLQFLANQDDLGLELAGQISLNGPRLQPGQASGQPAGLDPEWLLAMWQDPRSTIELEIPQQAVDITQQGKLKDLLESQVLELLLESSEQPFQSLAKLSGSETELPAEITFPAGSAATGTANDQAIDALGKALALRPGLSLDIPAVYDPLIDNKALQTEQVRTHIALAGAAELSFQSGAEPTDFSDPVVHSVIDEFARQRLPVDVLAAFVEHFGQADVDQGILPEGDIAAYYAALFELLVDYAEIPQTALTSLAKYRAQAVVDGLTRPGVEPRRLQVSTEAQTSAARMDGVPLPLRLGVWSDPEIKNPTTESGVEPWE